MLKCRHKCSGVAERLWSQHPTRSIDHHRKRPRCHCERSSQRVRVERNGSKGQFTVTEIHRFIFLNFSLISFSGHNAHRHQSSRARSLSLAMPIMFDSPLSRIRQKHEQFIFTLFLNVLHNWRIIKLEKDQKDRKKISALFGIHIYVEIHIVWDHTVINILMIAIRFEKDFWGFFLESAR